MESRNEELWVAVEGPWGKEKEGWVQSPQYQKGFANNQMERSFHGLYSPEDKRRTIPLAYATRPDKVVPDIRKIQSGTPHLAKHSLIEDELIARASFTYPIFQEDNEKIYYGLEEGKRSTSYTVSIKPFQQSKNGRGAWLDIKEEFSGKNKLESEIRQHKQLIHTEVWKDQSNFPSKFSSLNIGINLCPWKLWQSM